MTNRKPTYTQLEQKIAELEDENELLNSRLDLVSSAAQGDLDDIEEEDEEEDEE